MSPAVTSADSPAAGATTTSRRLTVADVRLFAQACRLMLRVRELKQGVALPVVAERLLAKRFLPREVGPEAALLATARASRRLDNWPGVLTTCLARSLVTGTLLADRDGVELHIGFRSNEVPQDPIDAHAWLTLEEEVLADPTGGEYTEILRLPLRRG